MFSIKSKANNVCGLTTGEIIYIENICSTRDDKKYIIGKEFLSIEPLYVKPCISSHLGIHMVSKLSPRSHGL